MILINKFSRMEQWEKNLYVLWLGVLLGCASYTMIVPFLPMYLLLELGVSEDNVGLWSGLIFSVSFMFGAVMAPYWGAKADKYGKKKMVLRAGISLAIVYLLAGAVQTPMQLLIVRIIHGMAIGFVPGSISIVAASLPKEKMGWGLGLMQTANATGSILGPLFGGFLATIFGMRMSFVVASSGLFLGTIAIWYLVKENFTPPVAQKEAPTLIGNVQMAYKNKPLLHMLLIVMTVQACVMILQPLLTIYISQMNNIQGSGVVFISGLIFSLVGFAGIIAAPLWGKFGQKQGFMKVLFFVLMGAGTLNVLQVFSNNIFMFGTLHFIYGLFIAGSAPTIQANIVSCTDASFQGRAFGLSSSAQQLGSMIGPLIGGAFASIMDIRYIFIVSGCILFVAASSTYQKSG